MLPGPFNWSLREQRESHYLKNGQLSEHHKSPAALHKPRSLYKRLAVRYCNRAPPINLQPGNTLSPRIPPRCYAGIHTRIGSQWKLMIWQLNDQDSDSTWSTTAGPCSHQGHRVYISNLYGHPLKFSMSRLDLKLFSWLPLVCGVYSCSIWQVFSLFTCASF